jgi:hypothetical protein
MAMTGPLSYLHGSRRPIFERLQLAATSSGDHVLPHSAPVASLSSP